MIRRIIIALLIFILTAFIFSSPWKTYAYSSKNWGLLVAQEKSDEKEKEEEEDLSKGDFILLLTATDFMRKRIQDLLSWSIGYDVSTIARAKLVPTIKYIKAKPIKVPPDGRTVIFLLASVDDPQGLQNIEAVRADLSSIGRLPNSMLVDNGLWGDEVPNDGIYTLQTSIDKDITRGEKEISIAVSNKKGWLALGKTNIDVEKEPKILETKATPDKVRSGSGSVVTFTVRIENPGRIEDIKKVSIDLSPVKGKIVTMRNDGSGGDAKAGDNVFTYRSTIPSGVGEGEKKLIVKVANVVGGESTGELTLNVVK